MLSVVSPSFEQVSPSPRRASWRAARVGLKDIAASATTPLRSLQLCEALMLLPTCNRSPCAQPLRLGRGDRITDVFAQVQHQIATSQITLKALPAGKESSSGCYGRLKATRNAGEGVRVQCAVWRKNGAARRPEAITMHHESST